MKRYDAVVIGSGHNRLVAACYLAKAGKSVLVLEKSASLGGATTSVKAFKGVEAKLSRYSYLVSLLPDQIVKDLSLNFETIGRKVSSYTPYFDGQPQASGRAELPAGAPPCGRSVGALPHPRP